MSIFKKDIYVVLHNIRSAYNVGSIFRTADAVGVSKIYLCGYTPAPERFKIYDSRLRREFGGQVRFKDKSENQNKIAKTALEADPAKSPLAIAGQGSNKVSKTALGAENYVPWEQCRQTWRLLKKLNKEGIKIIALEQASKSKNIFSAEGRSALGGKYKSIALIVGHERKGLSDKILKYTDEIVEIPMYGEKESLNVSVATGVALYQLKIGDNLRL